MAQGQQILEPSWRQGPLRAGKGACGWKGIWTEGGEDSTGTGSANLGRGTATPPHLHLPGPQTADPQVRARGFLWTLPPSPGNLGVLGAPGPIAEEGVARWGAVRPALHLPGEAGAGRGGRPRGGASFVLPSRWPGPCGAGGAGGGGGPSAHVLAAPLLTRPAAPPGWPRPERAEPGALPAAAAASLAPRPAGAPARGPAARAPARVPPPPRRAAQPQPPDRRI